MSKEDDKKDWNVAFAPGVKERMDEELGPEAAGIFATEFMTTIAAGGIEALLAKSKRVLPYDANRPSCVVCEGPLTPDEVFEEDHLCNATDECKKFVYCTDV